eukprot:COSAG01_NODE_2002_length_8672_cov_53.309227_10_plen_522_part_00
MRSPIQYVPDTAIGPAGSLTLQLDLEWAAKASTEHELLLIECERADGGIAQIEVPVVLVIQSTIEGCARRICRFVNFGERCQCCCRLKCRKSKIHPDVGNIDAVVGPEEVPGPERIVEVIKEVPGSEWIHVVHEPEVGKSDTPDDSGRAHGVSAYKMPCQIRRHTLPHTTATWQLSLKSPIKDSSVTISTVAAQRSATWIRGPIQYEPGTTIEPSGSLILQLDLEWAAKATTEYELLLIKCTREDGGIAQIEVPVVLNVQEAASAPRRIWCRISILITMFRRCIDCDRGTKVHEVSEGSEEVSGLERIVEVIKEVPGPERIVEVIKEVPGPERIVEVIKEVPGPTVEVIKEVPGPERIVEVIKEVPGPERVVIKEVPGPERIVEVPGPKQIVIKKVDRIYEVAAKTPPPPRIAGGYNRQEAALKRGLGLDSAGQRGAPDGVNFGYSKVPKMGNAHPDPQALMSGLQRQPLSQHQKPPATRPQSARSAPKAEDHLRRAFRQQARSTDVVRNSFVLVSSVLCC